MNPNTVKTAESVMRDIKDQLNQFLDDDLADGVIEINANDSSYLLDYIKELEKIAVWAEANS